MISEKHKCIFVHIPKVAGQSIELFFLGLNGLSWEAREALLLKYNPDPELGPERLAHLTASEYVDLGHITRSNFDDYFKFSFVRNPWARLVSEYLYRDYHKKMSFRAFVAHGLPQKSDYSDTYRHILPQYQFIYDNSGKNLLDFVGRFENLQQDFDLVCSRLEVAHTKLPHVNSATRVGIVKSILDKFVFFKLHSSPQSYVDYYDEKTKRKVEQMYISDIETFKYRFSD